LFLASSLGTVSSISGSQPDTVSIIERSVKANDTDFAAAPRFNYKEFDRESPDKTYQILMIDGSPYKRLIALNHRPLSRSQAAEEARKEKMARAQRQSESPRERQNRIAKYEAERNRDHQMMGQLTEAFVFQLIGTQRVSGFKTYVLKATPRPGYRPPNTETQVLKGMAGKLWIDQESYQWVRVTAEVIHPVTIDGFLARVEPGTRFELEKSPVADGIWEITHFVMRSNAKVLFVVPRQSQEEERYYDFQPLTPSGRRTH